MYQDGQIENDAYRIKYFELVTENIRNNSRKITRNSFWLILSFVVYILLRAYDFTLGDINILFFTIKDNKLLLTLIPVFFSFIFFQNVTLWRHNENLLFIFDGLSQKMFSLAIATTKKDILRPFSILYHFTLYQYTNKKVPKFFKYVFMVPIYLLVSAGPAAFIIFTLYEIAVTNYFTLVPVVSFSLTAIILIITIVQIAYSHKV